MKRALLFSGGIDRNQDHLRYRNNLAAFYKLLLQHNYNKSEIAVCSATGGERDFDEDGTEEAFTRGSHDQLVIHLKWLAEAQRDDTIVFVASNHGEEKGLNLWGTEIITPTEINDIFQGCEATKIFIFGQCYSGVFGSELELSNAVICCACGDIERSYPISIPTEPKLLPNTQPYDEFLYHMIGALSGQHPPENVLPQKPPAPPKVNTIYAALSYARKKARIEATPLFFPEDQEWAKQIPL